MISHWVLCFKPQSIYPTHKAAISEDFLPQRAVQKEKTDFLDSPRVSTYEFETCSTKGGVSLQSMHYEHLWRYLYQNFRSYQVFWNHGVEIYKIVLSVRGRMNNLGDGVKYSLPSSSHGTKYIV